MFPGLKLDLGSWGAICPHYKGKEDWEAVDALFELEQDEYGQSNDAEYLFLGLRYPEFRPTPKQVAKRIKQFVDERSPSGV